MANNNNSKVDEIRGKVGGEAVALLWKTMSPAELTLDNVCVSKGFMYGAGSVDAMAGGAAAQGGSANKNFTSNVLIKLNNEWYFATLSSPEMKTFGVQKSELGETLGLTLGGPALTEYEGSDAQKFARFARRLEEVALAWVMREAGTARGKEWFPYLSVLALEAKKLGVPFETYVTNKFYFKTTSEADLHPTPEQVQAKLADNDKYKIPEYGASVRTKVATAAEGRSPGTAFFDKSGGDGVVKCNNATHAVDGTWSGDRVAATITLSVRWAGGKFVAMWTNRTTVRISTAGGANYEVYGIDMTPAAATTTTTTTSAVDSAFLPDHSSFYPDGTEVY